LHYAAAVDFGDTAIAELLLKAGARADLPDKQGVTARQMAEQSNRRIVPLLAGANGAAPLKTAFVGASDKQL
jgi:ankyrin repeat protein